MTNENQSSLQLLYDFALSSDKSALAFLVERLAKTETALIKAQDERARAIKVLKYIHGAIVNDRCLFDPREFPESVLQTIEELADDLIHPKKGV
jgi:hypothetical protein